MDGDILRSLFHCCRRYVNKIETRAQKLRYHLIYTDADLLALR
jgi:hypothetical protein